VDNNHAKRSTGPEGASEKEMISLRALFHHAGSIPFFPLNLRFCSRLGKGNPKSVLDMLIDSAIVGGCAAVGVLAGFGLPTSGTVWPMIWAVSVAFLSAFFPQFAYERKIKTAKKEIV